MEVFSRYIKRQTSIERALNLVASVVFSIFVVVVDVYHGFKLPYFSVAALLVLIMLTFGRARAAKHLLPCTPFIFSLFLICFFWVYDYNIRKDGPFNNDHLIGVHCAGRLGQTLYGSIPKFNLADAEDIVIEKLCPEVKAWELRSTDSEGPESERFRFIESNTCLSKLKVACFSVYGELQSSWNIIDDRLF